jgi:endoglucanase
MHTLFFLLMLASEPTTAIKVDQVGYLPDAPKVAIVVAEGAAKYQLKRAGNGKVVDEGALSEAAADANSGDRVQQADFSKVKAPGKYYLEVPGVGKSYTFEIGYEAYRRAYVLAMRSYYGQRCGTAVNMGPEFPQYHYEACHAEGAWHASSGKEGARASAKGWHDAGDYGRYVVNSGISTGTLLWTYEMYGRRVGTIGLQIPESGNGTPDLLNEIRWNLNWMLTMQDTDGGVWHKQTSEKFPGFVMPDADKTVSYAIGTGAAPYKNSCATADFAAVMAIAARTYKRFDPGFAKRANESAEKAWTWLEANPNVLFRNPAGVSTGAYGDGNCSDEMLWAAAELARTTKAEKYEKYFLANYAPFLTKVRPPDWTFVAPLGLWTYAMAQPSSEAAKEIRTATEKSASEIAARTAANGYRIAMTTNDYVWGSNAVAANYALLLMVAEQLLPNHKYAEAAAENLHYLLGRNEFSVSWVTWVGSNWYKNPHHRPSGADGVTEPWPGLLSGGPNRSRQDEAMKKLPQGVAPMKSWLDELESYATNEVAINWNAPLVFVLAGLNP